MDVYIKENAIIARLAARILKVDRVAVTINNTIYLHNCSKQDFLRNQQWVCHELAHTMQYKRIGMLNFIVAYLFQCVQKGYNKNRFEIEARAKEKDLMLMEGINFI